MLQKKIFFRVLLLTMMILLAVTSFALADTMRAARITEVKGDVKIRKAGGEKLYPALEGAGLVQGDSIISGKDGSVKISIDDDKIVRISNNTKLILSELLKSANGMTEETSLSLLSGKVLITVEKKLSKDSKFNVKTPTAVMGVRGTQFFVGYALTGATSVAVLDGTVQVTNPVTTTTTTIEEGNSVIVDDTTDIMAPIPIEDLNLDPLDLLFLEDIKDLGVFDPTLLEELDQVINEKKSEESTTPEDSDMADEELIILEGDLDYEDDGADFGDLSDEEFNKILEEYENGTYWIEE